MQSAGVINSDNEASSELSVARAHVFGEARAGLVDAIFGDYRRARDDCENAVAGTAEGDAAIAQFQKMESNMSQALSGYQKMRAENAARDLDGEVESAQEDLDKAVDKRHAAKDLFSFLKALLEEERAEAKLKAKALERAHRNENNGGPPQQGSGDERPTPQQVVSAGNDQLHQQMQNKIGTEPGLLDEMVYSKDPDQLAQNIHDIASLHSRMPEGPSKEGWSQAFQNAPPADNQMTNQASSQHQSNSSKWSPWGRDINNNNDGGDPHEVNAANMQPGDEDKATSLIYKGGPNEVSRQFTRDADGRWEEQHTGGKEGNTYAGVEDIKDNVSAYQRNQMGSRVASSGGAEAATSGATASAGGAAAGGAAGGGAAAATVATGGAAAPLLAGAAILTASKEQANKKEEDQKSAENNNSNSPRPSPPQGGGNDS